MKVLKENNISTFDVDGTLVLWPKDYHQSGYGRVDFNYGDELIYLYPHVKHVTFLKHCYNRGDYVEVWSQNGYEWAEQVIKKLDLEQFVHIVRSKPTRHVDDKESLSDIVGNRIFLNYSPDEE